MEKWFEKYITDHSTPEDPLLEELYRQTHLRFVNPNMAVGFIQGKFLEFISRMIKPHKILEIGTFTGYSTICLAKGLEQAGKLITIEINDELKEFAQTYFKRAGLESVITQITGRAQDIIPELDHLFDLAYIDGDKREYIDYYFAVTKKMRPGGYIFADNVLWGEKIFDKTTKDPQTRGIIEFNEMIKDQKNIEKIILPVRDGLMLIRIIS
ncbi:MAG: O-methyltransferase [Bacteroidales bacterium]|nr:O-methyltransferase [Bacteroidales bacterium]